MSGPIYGVGPAMPFPVLTLEQKQKIKEKQAKKEAAKEAKILKQKQKYDNREDAKTVASFFKRRKKRQSVVFDHSRRKSVDSVDLFNHLNKGTLFPPNPNANPLTQTLEARTEEHPMKGTRRRPFVLPPYSRNRRSRSSTVSSPASRRSSTTKETEISSAKSAVKDATRTLTDAYNRTTQSRRASVDKSGLESMNVTSEAQPFCLPYSDNPSISPEMGAPDDFPGSTEQLQRFKASIRRFENRSWQQQLSRSNLNKQIEGIQPGDLACNIPIEDTIDPAHGKFSEFSGRSIEGGLGRGDLEDDNDGSIAHNLSTFDDEGLSQPETELVDSEDSEESFHEEFAYTTSQAESEHHSQHFHDCQRWLEKYTSDRYLVNNPQPRPPFGRTVEFLEAYPTKTKFDIFKNAPTFDQLWSEWSAETSLTGNQRAFLWFKSEKAMLSFFDSDYETICMNHELNLDKIDGKSSLDNLALYCQQVMAVQGTELDTRSKNDSFVAGGPRMRFIAAAPLLNRYDHTAVGVIYEYTPQQPDDSGPELHQSMANVALRFLQDSSNQGADLVNQKLRKFPDGSSVECLDACSFIFSYPTPFHPIDGMNFNKEMSPALRFPNITATRPFIMNPGILSCTKAGSIITSLLLQNSQTINIELMMPPPLILQSIPSEQLSSALDYDSSDNEHPANNRSSSQHSTIHQDIDNLPLQSNIDDEEHPISGDVSFQPPMNISKDFDRPSLVPDPAPGEHRFSFVSSCQLADVSGGVNFGDPWAAEDEERSVNCAGSFEDANVHREVVVDGFYEMENEDFYEPEIQDKDEYHHELAVTDAGLVNLANDEAYPILPPSLRITKTPVQSAVAKFCAPTSGKRYPVLQTRLSMMSFGAAEVNADLSRVRRYSDRTETLEAHSGLGYPEDNKYDFRDPERDEYAAWYNDQPYQTRVNLETPAQRKLNISKKLIKDQEEAKFYDECPAVFDTPINFRESRSTPDLGHTSDVQDRRVFGMSENLTHQLEDEIPSQEDLETGEWDSNDSPTRNFSEGSVVAGDVDPSLFNAPAPDGLMLLKIATITNPGVPQNSGQGGVLSSLRDLEIYKSLVNESPLKFNGGESAQRSAKSLCNPRDPLLLQACIIMSSAARKLGFDLLYAAELKSPNSTTSDVGLVQGGLLDRNVVVAHGLRKKISVLHPGMHLAALRVDGLYTWDPPNRATKESQEFDHGYMMPIVHRPEERYRTDGIVICAYRYSAGYGPFKSKRSDWIAFYNFVQNELRPVMENYEAQRLGLPNPEPRPAQMYDQTRRDTKRRISRFPEHRPLPSLQELASSISRPSSVSATSKYSSRATICPAFPAGEATELQMYNRELRRYESVPDLKLRSGNQMENDEYLEQQVQASREQRGRQRRLRATYAADEERRRRLLAPDAASHPQFLIEQREHQRRLHTVEAKRRERLLAPDAAANPQPTVERPRLVPRLAPVPEKKGLGGFLRSLGNR